MTERELYAVFEDKLQGERDLQARYVPISSKDDGLIKRGVLNPKSIRELEGARAGRIDAYRAYIAECRS